MLPTRTSIRASATLLCLVATLGQTWGEEYLSNLKNLYIGANPDIIADIEVLDYFYGPFLVYFFPGSGLDERRYAKMSTGIPPTVPTNFNEVEHFQLDSVTFEFLGSPTSPWTNISMTIQVYQKVSSQSILLGELGNDTVNPTPTQWPHSTTFIDFHPLTNILLQPSSEYFISLSEPYNFPDVFGLLFTYSPHYDTSTDWRMGRTTWHVPISDVEYLKFAVNATAMRGTNSTGRLGTNSTGVAVSNVKLSASRVGTNIVLSWPAATVRCQLYASPSFQPGGWSPAESTRSYFPPRPRARGRPYTLTLLLFKHHGKMQQFFATVFDTKSTLDRSARIAQPQIGNSSPAKSRF